LRAHARRSATQHKEKPNKSKTDIRQSRNLNGGKKMNSKTRTIVVTGMLIAICAIFFLTGISYVYIPFSLIQVTIMGLPVIIGTIMEGLYPGLILGFVFGITSLIDGLWIHPTGLALLIPQFPLEMVLIIFIPRLLIPLFTWFVYKSLISNKPSIKRQTTVTGIAALVGSLTNTVFFLGMLTLLIKPEQLSSIFGTAANLIFTAILAVVVSNGIPEAIFVTVITIPIILALKRIYGISKSIKKA
jgi:uncharacterized membrane protein